MQARPASQELANPACPAASQVGSHRDRRRLGPDPLLRRRQALPRRPLQGRPALAWSRSPRRSPGPSTSATSSCAPPSSSTANRPGHRQGRPDPADPQGRAAADQGRAGDPRPRQVLAQPDQLRAQRDHRPTSPATPGPSPDLSEPLPGRGLREPRLQAEADGQAERRHQARRPPGLRRHVDFRRRPGQHQGRPGHPAALGVPRPGPHQHDLHPGAGRRQRLPGGSDLRLRRSDHAAARTAS